MIFFAVLRRREVEESERSVLADLTYNIVSYKRERIREKQRGDRTYLYILRIIRKKKEGESVTNYSLWISRS